MPTNTNGHFHVHVCYIDPSLAQDWLIPLRSRDQAARGIIMKLSRCGLNNVRAIFDVDDAEMRPGYYFAFAPDATSGTVATTTSGNIRYNSITSNGGYCAWNVPASAHPGMNKLVIAGNGDASAVNIVRTRSGSDTTLASNQSFGSSYQNPATITLSDTLEAGDTVKIVCNAAFKTLNIACIWGYNSTATPTDVHHRIHVGQLIGTATNSCWIAGSSSETAFELSPTGSTLKFFGGAAHNDGTVNCAEVSVTESWLKGGTSWSLTGGYFIDTFTFTRNSTARYNDGSTILGNYQITYDILYNCLKTTPYFTVGATAINTGWRYVGMLPAAGIDYVHDDAGHTASYTPTSTWSNSVRTIAAYGTTFGNGLYLTMESGPAMVYVASEAKGTRQNKGYFGQTPTTANSVAPGTTWTAIAYFYPDAQITKTTYSTRAYCGFSE